MKKIMIILIVLISIRALNSHIPDIKSVFNNKLNLNKIHFDGLLTSTTEFSQEDYDVGDIIDITIHFEVNTTKNVENFKFAITDYKNKVFYSLYKRHFDTITQEDKDTTYEYLTKKDTSCKFIESDPDLVLSNNQPKGVYHLKFELTKKTIGITSLGKQYPYIFCDLLLYSFAKEKKFEYITDYKGFSEHLTIPIKIKPTALKNGKPSKKPEIKSIPADLPDREMPKFPANESERYNQKNETSSSLRIVQKVLSGKITYCAVSPEPYLLDSWNQALGSLSIVHYNGYDCIKIVANNHTNFTGRVWYYDTYYNLYYFDINIIDSYDLDGNIKMWHYGNNYVDGNGTMQKVNYSGTVIAECPLDDDGYYELYNFSPDDDIRYVAKNEENGVAESFILEYYDDEVIVSNSAFGLDPQTVYYLLNDDDSELDIFYYNGSTTYQNHIYYIQDTQIVADNWIFDSQKRAEEFSQDYLFNPQRELLFIYADVVVNHPDWENTGFLPQEELPDYDFDFVHIKLEHIDETSTVLHELGHAQHWHHAGFSLEHLGSHTWAGHYYDDLALREGFATFFSCVVRELITSDYFDSPENYWEFNVDSNIYDVELPTLNPQGNDCEGAVCGMIWDLYDNMDFIYRR